MLARWSPWDELQQLEREMAGFTRRVVGGMDAGDRSKGLAPAVDVFPRGNDLVVRAELPGIDPERDVDVSVQDGILVIRGERRSEDKVEAKDFVRMESSYGAFLRSVPLPSGVKEDDIRATYENGILEVVVPGAAKMASPKKIAVSSGDSSSQPRAVGSGRRKSA